MKTLIVGGDPQGLRHKMSHKETDPSGDCGSAPDNFHSRKWTEITLTGNVPRYLGEANIKETLSQA